MTPEQVEVLEIFTEMLRVVTADGGRKRSAGLKPSWKVDPSHKAAVFSHLMKREKGELQDADSGAHPYVHAAWRLLAIAYQENIKAENMREMTLRQLRGQVVPSISSDHDAVAEALDTPLCGNADCQMPQHQRDSGPPARWER